MQKFASALAVLALVGGVTLTGCKTDAPAAQKGVVSAFDQPTNSATIDGTTYTVSPEVTWPVDLAPGDSVEFTAAANNTLIALNKINRLGAVSDSAAATGDSLAAGVDSAAAAMGSAVDSAQAGAADALNAAGAAMDSAAKN